MPPRYSAVEGRAGRSVHTPVSRSTACSGDLAPLAYLSGALAGFEEAEVMYKGRRMSAPEAIRQAGIGPVQFELKAKDGSALINGCTVSLAGA